MKDKSRKLTVINTGAKSAAVTQKTVVTSATAAPGATFTPIKDEDILSLIYPVLSGMDREIVAETKSDSLLTNPTFTNNAEAWTILQEDLDNERVQLLQSGYKTKLVMRDGGAVYQANSYIRKPGTHFIYKLEESTEDEEDTEEGTTGESGEGTTEAPSMIETKEEVPDTVYLSMSFICPTGGTLGIGFQYQEKETDLEFAYYPVESSTVLQTVTAQGTWDGTGLFFISVIAGELEIISLDLTDNPAQEFQKQTDSAILQINANIQKAYQYLRNITELQSKVSSLEETITSLEETITSLEERITALEKTSDSNEEESQ